MNPRTEQLKALLATEAEVLASVLNRLDTARAFARAMRDEASEARDRARVAVLRAEEASDREKDARADLRTVKSRVDDLQTAVRSAILTDELVDGSE